ncbi:MAG: metallophosphoesterase [Clostridia bacterium]
MSNTLIVVTEYTIASAKLPASFSGFRIVQVSDLHSKDFGNYLIRQIQQQRPDIVVMTGDMVNSYDSDFQTFLTFAEQVSDQYETYYIVGNHEQILKESKRGGVAAQAYGHGHHSAGQYLCGIVSRWRCHRPVWDVVQSAVLQGCDGGVHTGYHVY